ncbi:type II secretion system GspH family protein [Blastopirellula sp. J2-11]|uniref:type II secretion system protein n=1 Tax=Blastopirellula sp. J2-11 TaxID=2943192 RepID=UPI0021CA0D9B|nr:type II secretion system protein [Blastopirellula sp. J2-11]UUO05260.1 type II secretion system GspH family protein [Blastopirellula sp. J2-11]
MKTRALATRRKLTQRGFTLVELLVVITIIGILAGLALVAIPAAVGRVKEAAITAELAQIETAMKLFQSDHGAFPPDLNATCYPTVGERQGKIRSFMRKLSPRIVANDLLNQYDPTDMDQLKLIQNLELAGCVSPNAAAGTIVNGKLELDRIGPAEALVVFLSGFSSDVERPFTGTGDRKKYFGFAVERLKDLDNDGWLEYYPSGVDGAPYVYFNSTSYVNGNGVARFPNDPNAMDAVYSTVGQARPYCATIGSTSGFANPDTFQIVTAGIDGHFGNFPDFTDTDDTKYYPTGLSGGSLTGTQSGFAFTVNAIAYTTDDRDNITNFAQGPLRNKEPE